MEESAQKRSHHKKKKKHSRHSSASSHSSSDEDGARRHAPDEHRKKKHRQEERHKSRHDKHRHDRGEHRKRHSSPEVRNAGKDDRERHHRERTGSRWEEEDSGPPVHRIKQEAPEDRPRRPTHQDNGPPRESTFQRGRGGRPWGRGGGRGRGRGRGVSSQEGEFEWGRSDQSDRNQPAAPKVEKEKPNFGLSGKLTEDTNTINGIVIKYSEPPESRKPKRRWRLYVFKGEETLPTLYIHRQSAYLMGRDRKVADIPLDHPSVSKQHAALQYRLVTFKRESGIGSIKCIRPYIIDLESANGTYVNNKKIESKKYVELMEKDVLKFGYSSREYVLLHEHSQDTNSGDDDDVQDEGPNP